jgi:hypothetical protein
MRRKKLFLVVLILLVVGARMFFVAQSSSVPLDVHILGATNYADGSTDIYFDVSNRTSRDCHYFFESQVLSNGVWIPSYEGYFPFSKMDFLHGHAKDFNAAFTRQNTGVMRLRVEYRLRRSAVLYAIDDWAANHDRRSPFGNPPPKEFTTPPFELPPRGSFAAPREKEF